VSQEISQKIVKKANQFFAKLFQAKTTPGRKKVK